MDKLILNASTRTERGKKLSKVRANGLVPAVAYGREVASESVSIDARELTKVYRQAGGNKLVDFKIGDGKSRGVIIHEVQLDGRSGAILHADLYLVRMNEVLTAEIPLHFVGESTAVYQLEGVLLKNLETVEVECLPADLPESIEVDISVLDEFEKSISVADLVIPKGVKLLVEDTETLVVKVEAPRSDEEIAELEADLTEVLPEGVKEDEPAVVAEESGGNRDKK
ncbi:50S ribosomal protein L25 [Candidatus Saccharibacteria bacterium]|nr:50S ribosomal protein L25 [Candidatus Saccharibacteria bacterium]